MTPRAIAKTSDWLVVDKPAGWLTIPGRDPGASESVLSAWAERELGGEKAWVVHRIDRETSGLVLFARNAEAHRTANEWFERHRVKKLYHLIAQGVPASPLFKLTHAIE